MVFAKSGGLKGLLSKGISGFMRQSESSHFLVPFHPSGGACRERPPGGSAFGGSFTNSNNRMLDLCDRSWVTAASCDDFCGTTVAPLPHVASRTCHW